MTSDTPILERLGSSQQRNDEQPKIDLAEDIVANRDERAIDVLIAALSTGSQAIRSDAIKVLYEVGAREPALIADHVDVFVDTLESRNNRLQWGAMTALAAIAPETPDPVYRALPRMLVAAERGSVITRDQAVQVLIALSSFPRYAEEALPLLLAKLTDAPPNQLPMYAERALPVIAGAHRSAFEAVLRARLDDLPQESKRKRVMRVIRRLE